MGNHFLPASIDNHYRGSKLALWFFWIVVIMRGLQGLSLIVGGPSIVRDADGIPLESFPIGAAQSIVTVFMISGPSRLVLSLVGVLVFVRYRSAVALMFAVLALDQLGKEILLHFNPLVRVGNPLGPTINLVLLILTIVGLLLSISARRNPTAQP
jgi:hypothetical protein